MSNLPVYLELISKLNTLKEAVDRGFLVHLVGSPLRELSHLIADLLSQAALSMRVNREERLNSGIIFETESEISSDEYLLLSDDQKLSYFFGPFNQALLYFVIRPIRKSSPDRNSL